VEDFTEFEQRAAYFDGDPVIAEKKGDILDQGAKSMPWPSFRSYWISLRPQN
jgi:hypothetical protein